MAWALPFACIPIIVVAATKALMIMKWDALVYGFFKPALLIVTTLGFWLFDAGLPGLWRGYLLTNIALAGIALYIFGRHFSFRKLFRQIRHFRYFPALVSYAIPQNLNMTFNSFINNLDVMMLSYFGVRPELIGFYGMGAQIVINLRQVRLVFSGAYAPVISRLWAERNREEMNRSFSMVFRWTTTFAFPIALLIFVFRQDLLRIFHSSYTDDTTFMVLLLVPALLNCSIGLAGHLMAMTGHSLWNLANSIAIAGVSLLFNALLIPRYGILGAAGASALAGTLIYFLVLLEARLVLGVTLIWKRIYKPLLAAVPALVITFVFTSQGLATHLALRVVLALLNTLSFAAALAALKLEPGDREALFPWFRRWRGSLFVTARLTIGPLPPMMSRMNRAMVRRDFGSASGVFEAGRMIRKAARNTLAAGLPADRHRGALPPLHPGDRDDRHRGGHRRFRGQGAAPRTLPSHPDRAPYLGAPRSAQSARRGAARERSGT